MENYKEISKRVYEMKNGVIFQEYLPGITAYGEHSIICFNLEKQYSLVRVPSTEDFKC